MSIVFIYFYQAAPAADKYPQFSESNGGARFCSSAADSFPSRGFLPPPLMTEMSLDHGVLYHAAAFVRYCRNARPFPFPSQFQRGIRWAGISTMTPGERQTQDGRAASWTGAPAPGLSSAFGDPGPCEFDRLPPSCERRVVPQRRSR